MKESVIVEELSEPEQSEAYSENSNSDMAPENTSAEQREVLRMTEIKPATERTQKFGLRFEGSPGTELQSRNTILKEQSLSFFTFFFF